MKLLSILMLASWAYAAPPSASFTVSNKTIVDGHITVNRNETVCFTSTSTDPDGDSLKYRWTFGDGGDTSGAANPCHTYRTAGSYAIKLKVSDRRDSMPFLTGKTPSSYTLPSGWTLVRTQDFETGSVGANETTLGSVTTNNPHSGNYSNQSIVWKDDCFTGWRLGSNITTGSELYISWYEYIDRQGKNNDEMFLFNIRKEFTSSYLQIRWQYLNSLSNWDRAFNIDSGNIVLFAEGDAAGATPSRAYYSQSRWERFGAGEWRQWEVYFKPATGGLKNGDTRIYLNGLLKSHVHDTDFNGTVNMTGASIELGGTTYTKIDWMSRVTLQCSQNIYGLDTSWTRPMNFKKPCLCPNQCPPSGYMPKFRRFVDDIIIAQRGN